MGDLNGDGRADLIIGAAGVSGQGAPRAKVGAVYVTYGAVTLQNRPADLTIMGAGGAGDDVPDAIVLERPVPVGRLPGFTEGRVSVQDTGAQRAAPWLDLCAGQRVLDACAAPGGKTAHMLEIADVDLTALEIDRVRAQRVESNLRRLDLSAALTVADCSRPDDWWDGRPFDAILLDAPCSGVGTLQRHPEIKWRLTTAKVNELAALQQKLLANAAAQVQAGGVLVYSVCSTESEEGEDVIAAFRATHPEFRDVTRERLAELGIAAEALMTPTFGARTFPHRQGCEGFFVCVLWKRR